MTDVGEFEGLWGDGAKWDKEIAVSTFYQYIVPKIGNEKQNRIKTGLFNWLTQRSLWADDEVEFNEGEFKSICKEAIETIRSATIKDLSENPEKYTKAVVNITDDKTGQVSEKELGFSKPLMNFKGGVVPEDKLQMLETYREARASGMLKLKIERQVLSSLEQELEKASTQKDEDGNEIKLAPAKRGVFTKLIKASKKAIEDYEESIFTIEEQLEEIRNPAYNDNVKVVDVENNTAEAQRFYQLYSLDPKDTKVALALATMVDVEEFSFMPPSGSTKATSKQKEMFETVTGLDYDNYQEELQRRRQTWANIMGVRGKLKGWMDNPDKGNELVLDLTDILQWASFPFDVESEEDNSISTISNEKDYLNFLQGMDKDQLLEEIQDLADDFESYWIHGFAKSPTTQLKIEARERRTKASGDKEEFVHEDINLDINEIKPLVEPLVDIANIRMPKKMGTTQNNIRYNLNFTEVLPFQEALAKRIGAGSAKAIGVKAPSVAGKPKIVAKGSFRVKDIQPLTPELQKKFPRIAANAAFTDIRKSVGAYVRRKSTTTEESLSKWLKTNFNKNLYGYLADAVEIIDDMIELEKLEPLDIDDEDAPKSNIPIKNYNHKYFAESNGTLKYTHDEMKNKLLSSAVGGASDINMDRQLIDINNILTWAMDMHYQITSESDDKPDEEKETDKKREAREEKEKEKREKEVSQVLSDEAEEAVLDQREAEGDAKDYLEEQAQRVDELEELEEEDRQKKIGREDEEDEGLYDYIKNLDLEELSTITDKIYKLSDEVFTKFRELKGKKLYSKDMLNRVNSFYETFTKEADPEDDNAFVNKWNREMVIDLFRESSNENDKTKNQLKEFKKDLESWWATEKLQLAEASEQDLIRVVANIDLIEPIAREFALESKLNNAKNQNVTLRTRNFNIRIDFLSNLIKIDGSIQYSIGGYADIGTHIRGGYIPPVDARGSPKHKPLSGKRVGPSGNIQLSVGQPIDEKRYELYKTIKSQMNSLVKGIGV